MKTTKQITEQENRIYKLMQTTTRQKLIKADPDTEGSKQLARIYGNQEAKKVMAQYKNRSYLIFDLLRNKFQTAYKNETPIFK
jgi:hypothetical protein